MANLGPLAGIRVVDFGRFIAGPYCAMLLADMGADVIRVDRRQGSEDRYLAPVAKSGEGTYFLSLNRNKRSLTLDTSKKESAEIIRRLAARADVVVANLPIDVLQKMGLNYETLRAVKPDIILRASRPSDRMALMLAAWALTPWPKPCPRP
jgi:crotonobetainyl-CoA:carnitine CoA-transferase CaiB-like acyl-CoA transferase